MLSGIDVSDYQGLINWQRVKDSGIAFAICKATDGESFVAKSFRTNWIGIKAVNMIRGAYHFCHTKNNPIKEATHFVNTVGETDETDMLVLDIEDAKSILTPDQFINWTLTFLEVVEKLSCITPIVYTGGPYFDKHGGKPDAEIISKFSRFPLWLAAYTKTPDKFVPYVWANYGWTIWQKSGDVAAKGEPVLSVPGIQGIVDHNQYRWTLEDLTIFAKNLHVKPSQIEEIPIFYDLPESEPVIDSSVDEPLKPSTSWLSKIKNKIFK